MTAPAGFFGEASVLGTFLESTYGTSTGITALTNAFVFSSETVRKNGKILERDGMRGFRDHVADDSVVGPYTVAGQITFEPTPVDLNCWLPFILGGGTGNAGTYGSFAVAETLPSFTLGIIRGYTRFAYRGCFVDKCVLSGTKGGILKMTLDIIAQSETIDSGTYPSISASVIKPYAFTQTLLTLTPAAGAVVTPINSFQLSIDNALIKDRFFNSLTIVNAPTVDRVVTLSCQAPWNSATAALYDLGVPGTDTTGTLVFDQGSGNPIFTATMDALQAPAQSPTAATRAENFFDMTWKALRTGTTPSISVATSATGG